MPENPSMPEQSAQFRDSLQHKYERSSFPLGGESPQTADRRWLCYRDTLLESRYFLSSPPWRRALTGASEATRSCCSAAPFLFSLPRVLPRCYLLRLEI